MPDTFAIVQPRVSAMDRAEAMTPERAYRAGWSARMQWAGCEAPPYLGPEERALWLEGYSDALDAPIGSGPDIADLMRVGVKW